MKFLVAEGADLEAQTAVGKTPLHLACYLNQAQCTEALLQSGADREAVDDENQTPYDLAAMMGHRQALLLLERYGQKVVWEKITVPQVPERWFQWTQNPGEYDDITEEVRAGMESLLRCPAFSGEQHEAEAAEAVACARQGGSETAAVKSVGNILQDLYDGTEAGAAADGCDDFFCSSDSEDSEEEF